MNSEGYSEENRPLREAVAEILEKEGVELVELTWRREGPQRVLRLLVDRPDGIKVDECAHLNRAIGELLDREDLIQEGYTLEVSSPGLDRPLVNTRDFERNIARMVRIVTKRDPAEKEKLWVGRLCEVSDENIVIIEKDGSSRIIPRQTIQKANLEVEF